MPVGWCQGSYWRLISTRSLTWCQVSQNPHQIFCAKAMLIILLDFSLIIRYDCAGNRAGKSARTMRTQESKFRIVATVTVVTTPQNPLLCHLRTLSAALWLIQWFLPTSCSTASALFKTGNNGSQTVVVRRGILSLNNSFMLQMRGVGPEVWRTSETPSLYRSLRFAILVMPAAFIFVSNTFIYTVWVVDADENDNNVWQLPSLFIPCPVPESGCIYIKQFTPKKCRPIASYPASWFPVQKKKKKAKRMLQHFFTLTVVAVLALLSSALNIPTLVNLRIEGSTTTIFEGTILTFGHNVTTPSGGDHHCDGTNNHANPLPGPTCTSALDDASKVAHFPFDG